MAGASYDVGSAFLQIVPSFDGVATTIDAQAAQWGESAGETFAESFKGVVNTELKDLDSVKITADTTAALAKISEIKAEMESLSSDDINVTLSDEEVQAKLAELQAELLAIDAEHPEITVNVDTGEAQLNLAELTAETVATDAALGDLGDSGAAASEGIDGAGASAGSASSSMSFLVAGVAALGVALVPIGGLFLGAFAAVPALISGALAGVGALYGALEPVITTVEAFSATKAPSTSSGDGTDPAQTAITNATAERNAAYSVQQAQEALTNAQVNGAEAVTQAQQTAADATEQAADKVVSANQSLVASEQAVTQAQFNETQAQEAVLQARQAAADQLQDYTDQLADNAISAQQDALNLTEAQQAYAEAMDPGTTATWDQQQQAGINLEQAQQAQQDLSDQNSQLEQTATAAFAAGVNGAQSVIDAENQLQQATLAVATAIQQQGDDQTAANQAAQAYAQQQVTNQQNIAKAQKQNAQGVADAEKALEQALANQKTAFETAALPAAGAASAINTYASDFKKLTPAGKNFVDFVEQQLLPAFTGISDIAQNGLLPGLEKGLDDMLPLFKSLGLVIWDAASGIGSFFQGLGSFAGSSTGLTQIQELFANGNTFMGDLGTAANLFLQSFVSVGAQSGPIVNALGTGIINLEKAFLNWTNDGGFQGFLQWLRENGPELVGDIGSFLDGMGKLFVALVPFGEFLDTLIGYFGDLVSWLSTTGDAFDNLGPGAVYVKQLVDDVGNAISDLVDDLEATGTHWESTWDSVEDIAKEAWTDLNNDLFQPIANFFTNTVPSAFDNFINDVKDLPSRAVAALGDFASLVWSKLELSESWLESNVWEPIDNFFVGLPDKIGTVSEHMWDGIEAAFVTMLNALLDVWNDLHFTLPSFNVGPIHWGGETIGMPHIAPFQVPQYHTGGVVQGTPGVEQLARLMPGEIVTPAGMQLPDFTGSSMAPTFIFNGVDFDNVGMVQNIVVDAFAQFVDELQPKAA